jgi:hypothetical protein
VCHRQYGWHTKDPFKKRMAEAKSVFENKKKSTQYIAANFLVSLVFH